MIDKSDFEDLVRENELICKPFSADFIIYIIQILRN